MPYDPDIHHRRSSRLAGFDYSRSGAYFVTICIHGKGHVFGQVTDGEMVLNEPGRMVERVWHDLKNRFPGIGLDALAVMPDHFHGIVVFNDRRGESCIRPDCGSVQVQGNFQKGDHKDRPYGTLNNSLGRIMQAFKSLTTVEYIRGVDKHGWPPFQGRLWQRNYYERIIRNGGEMNRLREYITGNPARWNGNADP